MCVTFPWIQNNCSSLEVFSLEAFNWLLKSCLCKIRSKCVKTHSIRFKTQYDVNKSEFYCNIKDETALLSNSFVVMIFHALLVVVSVTLAKQKEHYMKGQLNMLGLTITVLFTNILMTALVFNICLILRLCICHLLHHQHLLKTVTNLI